MLLPRVVAAALAIRQISLPQDYCAPQCPACKDNTIAFDEATSCVEGSQFLVNCGSCQQCVITYSIQNGTASLLDEVVNTLAAQINRCDDTPAKGQVSAIASQVSRLSDFNAQIATRIGSALMTTAAPTITSTSSSSVASRIAHTTSIPGPVAVNNSPTSETTEAPSTTTSGSTVGPGPKLSQSWIAGPVIGSILGMATVFVVIYCTRRKHNREDWALGNIKEKEIPDEDQESTRPPPPDEDAGKAMLHGESLVPKEMENTEVIPPVELPALEPVGMELLTPRSATDNLEKDWPLPVSPLPALFAMTEIRDERTGADSPKHNTFYHA